MAVIILLVELEILVLPIGKSYFSLREKAYSLQMLPGFCCSANRHRCKNTNTGRFFGNPDASFECNYHVFVDWFSLRSCSQTSLILFFHNGCWQGGITLSEVFGRCFPSVFRLLDLVKTLLERVKSMYATLHLS